MKMLDFLERVRKSDAMLTICMEVRGLGQYDRDDLYIVDNPIYSIFMSLFRDDLKNGSPYSTDHRKVAIHAFPISLSDDSFSTYCEDKKFGEKRIYTYNVGDHGCVVVVSENNFKLRKDGAEITLNFIKVFPLVIIRKHNL